MTTEMMHGITPERFCYWLNGFCELTEAPPTEAQWKAIKEHLEAVFFKVTPPAPVNVPVPGWVDQWKGPYVSPLVTC